MSSTAASSMASRSFQAEDLQLIFKVAGSKPLTPTPQASEAEALEEFFVVCERATKRLRPGLSQQQWHDSVSDIRRLAALSQSFRNVVRVARSQIDRLIVLLAQACKLAPESGGDVGEVNNYLGNALMQSGLRSPNRAVFEQAASAYNRAREAWRQSGPPAAWLRASINLGLALTNLGDLVDQTESPAILKKANETLMLCIEAMDSSSPEWERAHLNYANAKMSLSELEDKTSSKHTTLLKDAAKAYEKAITRRYLSVDPVGWAIAQGAYSTALVAMNKPDLAVQACRTALETLTRFPRENLEWARAQHNLGVALKEQGRRTGEMDLRQALSAFRAAVDAREEVPIERALSRIEEAHTLTALKQVQSAAQLYRETVPVLVAHRIMTEIQAAALLAGSSLAEAGEHLRRFEDGLDGLDNAMVYVPLKRVRHYLDLASASLSNIDISLPGMATGSMNAAPLDPSEDVTVAITALPAKAPELYQDRKPLTSGDRKGKKEDVIDFLRRVWKPWFGILTRADLLRLDPPAYQAIQNAIRKEPLPPDIDLPTRSEHIDRLAHADLIPLSEATRLGLALERRRQRAGGKTVKR